jgi:hypothetical protein
MASARKSSDQISAITSAREKLSKFRCFWDFPHLPQCADPEIAPVFGPSCSPWRRSIYILFALAVCCVGRSVGHATEVVLLLSECPRSSDRMERFACPSPDFRGRYRCIDDRALCDGFFDCPGREDESPEQCLFYKTVSLQSN